AFEVGKFRIFDFEGRQVGILRWGETEVYAVHNRCPHMGGPICRGIPGPKIVSRGSGVPGAVEADYDSPMVTCPWHKWEFQMKSGASVWNHKYRVRTYPVKVEAGRVF